MLDRCTHLSSINIDLLEHPAWTVNWMTMSTLFEDFSTLDVGLDITSLALSEPSVVFLGALVDGLGKHRLAKVKKLSLSRISLDTWTGPMEMPWTVPVAFSSLERLRIWLGGVSGPDALLQLLTHILDAPSPPGAKAEVAHSSNLPPVLPPIPTTTKPETNRSRRCPLRELTISEGRDLLNTSTLGRLLKIGNMAESLTTLRLRLLLPTSTTIPLNSNSSRSLQSPFDRLPSFILRLCPQVTHFHYLTWCPISFLLNDLPDRIVEMGVRIAESQTTHQMIHPGVGRGLGLPAGTLRNVEPLIYIVSQPQYRRGLKRLYVEWGHKDRDELAVEKVRTACEVAGVVFLDHVDF